MIKKINLLIVNGTLHGGGAEHVIATLVKNLDKNRFNVTVCYIKQGGVIKEELERGGYEVIGLSEESLKKGGIYISLELKRIVKSRSIDIVHSHDLSSFIHTAISKLFFNPARYAHTFHFGNYPHRPKKYLLIEKLLWRIPQKLVAVGEQQRQAIIKTFRIPDKRLEMLWNGVDNKQYVKSGKYQKYAKHDGKIIIGSLSTLIEQKGVDTLLRAVAMLENTEHDFTLLIVGEGPLRKKLEQIAKDLCIEDMVHFVGWVKDASSTVLPLFDVFVQSSLWEAMSVVILEAMAARKPIIATRVGENEVVLIDEETGLLVPAGNEKSLAVAIRRLLDDPDLRNKLGCAAQHRYETEFTGLAMAKRYEALYESMLYKDNLSR
jgi:glycosyltransferase involved in cell wall biosynthesis